MKCSNATYGTGSAGRYLVGIRSDRIHVTWLKSNILDLARQGQAWLSEPIIRCSTPAATLHNEVIVKLSILNMTELECVKYVPFDPKMTPNFHLQFPPSRHIHDMPSKCGSMVQSTTLYCNITSACAQLLPLRKEKFPKIKKSALQPDLFFLFQE